MSEKLKPCPFCGGEPNIQEIRFVADGIDESDGWDISCKECGITVHQETREEIVEIWNRRTP